MFVGINSETSRASELSYSCSLSSGCSLKNLDSSGLTSFRDGSIGNIGKSLNKVTFGLRFDVSTISIICVFMWLSPFGFTTLFARLLYAAL